MAVSSQGPTVGDLLRDWRRRRSVSQFELALGSAVSARHLSFIETGRSQPSREMVLHLAERLEVPLRERNALLLAAGYAPIYRRTELDASEMGPVRDALDKILTGHEPFPAIVVDRRWDLVSANGPTSALLAGIAEELLAPPANVLRASLHPDGLAPRIVNLGEYSAHLLEQLRRQIAGSADDELAALYDELRGYPGVQEEPGRLNDPAARLFVPFVVRAGEGELRFFSTVATFGTALDLTLAELAIESFFPADAATAATLAARR